MRQRIAISCARRIFLIVSGHQEPAFTVASLATTTTSRPCDDADAGDDAGAGRLAVVLVVRDEQADLEPGRTRVEQPLARARARVSLPCLCCCAMRVRAAALRAGASSSARTSSLSSRSRLTGGGHAFAAADCSANHVSMYSIEVGRGRAGPEQLADALLLQRVHVFLRDDAAAGDQDVVAALPRAAARARAGRASCARR